MSPAVLPSVHGGHSSIDNHRPWFSGFSPTAPLFLPEVCPNCLAQQWCYNKAVPATEREQIESLSTMYRCYRQVAEKRQIDPFFVTVHGPFPPGFVRLLEERYGQPYKECQIQMSQDDLPVFLEASKSIPHAAIEFDVLPGEYAEEVARFVRVMRDSRPDILRIGSLHFAQIGDHLIRQGKRDLGHTQAVFDEVGADRFWECLLEQTLAAVSTLAIHVLGHPFCWQKRLPEQCPVTPRTRALVNQIADVMARRVIAADLNTSGFAKGNFRSDPYFPPDWVAPFQAAGVRFTCGDDSHNQSQVGQCYEKLRSFVQRYGIKLWRPARTEDDFRWERIS